MQQVCQILEEVRQREKLGDLFLGAAQKKIQTFFEDDGLA